jgi:hypothetical protein
MADKQGRLAEILQQEYNRRGVVSGYGSAVGKRAREMFDFRNVLFGGTGVTSVIGRKIFGKGYSAARGDKEGSAEKVTRSSTELMSANTSILDEVNINSKITAKNTMSLPFMARDMNVMRQNIIKLVKLQGGTSTNKADTFFMRSSEREKAYEVQFGKDKKKSPEKITKENRSDTSFMSRLTGFIGSIFSGLSKKLLPLIGIAGVVGYALDSLATVIKNAFNWLADSWLGQKIGMKPITKSQGFGPFGRERNTQNTQPGDITTSQDNGVSLTQKIGDVALGGGSAIAGANAVRQGIKMKALTGVTKTAVLDVASMSVGQLAKSTPKSLWGKFLVFLAKRSPKLIQMFGLRLAQAGVLATIPFIGWVMAAVQLGFSLWAAWELYELWREFNNEEDTKKPSPSNITSPSNIPVSKTLSTGEEIVGTSPTPSGGNLMESVGRAEGGSAGYDAINRGKAGDTPNGMPGLSNLTVGQVMKLQDEGRVMAAGRYQVIPGTLKGLVKSGVVGVEDKFDSATQDKLFQALYNQRMKIAGDDPLKQQYELSKEFAAIANPYTGSSYYAGLAGNKASISSEQYNIARSGGSIDQRSRDFSQQTHLAMRGNVNINNSGNTITAGNDKKSEIPNTQLAQADVMDGDLMKELFRKRVVNYA